MALPRSAELRWQQEVIERWLITQSVPLDAREGLLELLKLVNQEIEDLEIAREAAFIRRASLVEAGSGLRHLEAATFEGS